MKIKEPAGNIELLPEGVYPAVLVEMLDLGRPRGSYEGADKAPTPRAKAVFQLEELNSFDERYELSTKGLNITWGKKGKWLPFLEQVLGLDKVKSALANGEFNPDALVGANVLLTIFHDKKGDGADAKTYLGISNISQPPKGMPPMYAVDYVLQTDRDGYVAAVPGAFEDVMEDVISTAPTFLSFKGEGYQPFGEYAAGEPRVWKKDIPTRECDYWTPTRQAAPIGEPPAKAAPLPPATRAKPAEERRPKAEVDPRSTNSSGPSSGQYAKDLAAGKEPVGMQARSVAQPVLPNGDEADDSIFDGE